MALTIWEVENTKPIHKPYKIAEIDPNPGTSVQTKTEKDGDNLYSAPHKRSSTATKDSPMQLELLGHDAQLLEVIYA